MVNYNNSIIYKLCCKDIDVKEVYVGSTTNFIRRRQQHKDACNNNVKYNYRVYQFIRANGGFENFDMIQIEKYSCDDKRELHARERYWIEELNATLNCLIPMRTHKEYYEKKKEKNKEYNKEYRKNNIEKIKEKKKEYYEKNKEKISQKNKKTYYCESCEKELLLINKLRHEKSFSHIVKTQCLLD
jgi:hypothetical protein